MKAAIDVLSYEGTRFAVLGDMFELGDKSGGIPPAGGELCRKKGIDEILCVGSLQGYL